jgi:HEAT repeat protein
VPDLIHALRDSDWSVREWAAKALKSIGLEAKPALAALTEALLDEVPGVREAASEALDQIRSAEGQE